MKQKTQATIKHQAAKKQPVPTFASHEEEADFWHHHSSEDFLWEDLTEPLEIDNPLKERIRRRAAQRMRSSKARARDS